MTSRALIGVQVDALLNRSSMLHVPEVFFKAIPNHTAVLVLGDILAAYRHSGTRRSRVPAPLMEGEELLLFPYEHFAEKLNVSVRSFSRAIDMLAKLDLVRRSRRDRPVKGKLVRNVVAVVPNLKVISDRCGLDLDDILAAPTLTPFQESLAQCFAEDFAEIIGQTYDPSPTQRIADLCAVVALKPPKGSIRPDIRVMARRYLTAKLKSQQEENESQEPALDRSGHPRHEYTLEAFVECAQDERRWPPRSRRRRL